MSGTYFVELRATLGDEQPADVRVEQVLRRRGEAVSTADVWAVRVTLDIRELVMLAVVRDPGEHRSLDRHRAEDRERPADPPSRLERPMREQAVIADRDPHAREHVADSQEQQVGPADPRVPEQADRGDESDEREHHSQEVRELVRACHLAGR